LFFLPLFSLLDALLALCRLLLLLSPPLRRLFLHLLGFITDRFRSTGLSLPFALLLLARLAGLWFLLLGSLSPPLLLLPARLLLLTFLAPTARRLSSRIGLLGPPLAHHLSLRQRLSSDYGHLQTLLPSHQTALLAPPWFPLRLGGPPYPPHLFGQLLLALLFLRFFHPSHHYRDLHRYGHGKPQALGSLGIHHLGLLPFPSSAFVVFVLPFHPKAQKVPARFRLLFYQVGHHRYRLIIAFFPPNQQASLLAISLFTPFPSACPTSTTSTQQTANGDKVLLPLGAKTHRLIDAQKWVPSLRLDCREEPARIESSVGHHDHVPLLWDHVRHL
jgi:hypothetical protein